MMVSEVKKIQKPNKSGDKEVDRTEEIKEYKEAYEELSKEVRTLVNNPLPSRSTRRNLTFFVGSSSCLEYR
jgi:hypothetical protein